MSYVAKPYFSLTPAIFASHFGASIIILDSDNDAYISIVDEAAQYLTIVTQEKFEYDHKEKLYSHAQYDTQQLNQWIAYFISKKFITPTDTLIRKGIGAQPKISGGLCDYKWDTKSSWQPFKNASKIKIAQAFITLCKVHWLLKRKGIKGILSALEKATLKTKRIPTAQQIQELADIVDAATLIFPKKSFCLAWASTFVILARKKQWDSLLVIGIQAQPFYAHAWAEFAGKVIHDDLSIAEVLSIILRFPEQ